jgi:hypothetical protein
LAVKAYDKALRAAKKKFWRTFCVEMDGIIPSASLHRVLSKDVSYQEGELTFSSGDFTSSDGEPAQHLQEHHNSGRVLQEPTQKNWDLTSEVVSEDKVRWFIDGFGVFKAAGEDGTFPGLLQHGIEIIIGHMTNIFAACLAYGYIPT